MTYIAQNLAGLPVDLVGLTTFVSACAPGLGAPETIELLTGGNSNLTLLATFADRRLVLRRRPFGPIPEQAHDMRREYETLRTLAPTPIPVPAVLGYSDDESVLGAPFYVMDFVEGVIVETADDLRPLALPARVRACQDVIQVLVELHDIPLTEFPTYQPGRSSAVMGRHLARWHERWGARPHRALPVVDLLADELRRRLPPTEERTFVHGDYRIGNMILDPNSDQRPVVGVLDWELSTFGNPLTDLAHLLAYWEGTAGTFSHPAQRIAGEAELPSGQLLADRYASLSGRSIEHLPFFVAFEHWRAAIIKEAIYQRRLQTGAPEAQIDGLRHGVDSHLVEATARLS